MNKPLMVIIFFLSLIVTIITDCDTESPSKPILAINETDFDFGEVVQGNILNDALTLYNEGSGEFKWSASADQSWITINPTNGSISTNEDTVAITINTSQMSLGVNIGIIVISSNTESMEGSPISVIVSLKIVENNAIPILTVDKTSLNYGEVVQGDVSNQTFTISNSGQGYFSWTASADQTWITLNPANGTIDSSGNKVTASINTSLLSIGNHTGNITITSSTANIQGSPKTIPVSLNISSIKTIPGHELEKNETWSGTNILKGDIVIPSGITLTILPGTVVKAVTNNLDWDGGFEEGMVDIYTNGNIQAIGIKDNVIVLTVDGNEPEEGDWWGIGMSSGSSIKLQYCAIAYAEYGIFLFSTSSDDPVLKNCLFKCTGGIVDFGSDNITIQYSTFIDGSSGYDRWECDRKANLSNCVFKNSTLIDISISSVLDVIDNTHITVKKSNFLNNNFYNLYIDGEDGEVINCSITADSCYGITEIKCTGEGNKITLNSPVNSPISEVGCGFTLPTEKNSLQKKIILPSKTDIKKRNKLILESNKREKNYRR